MSCLSVSLVTLQDDLLALVLEHLLPAPARGIGAVVNLAGVRLLRPNNVNDAFDRIHLFLSHMRPVLQCMLVCKRIRTAVDNADLWRDLCRRQWPWMQRQDKEAFICTLRRCMQGAIPHAMPPRGERNLVACLRQGTNCVAYGTLVVDLSDSNALRSDLDVGISCTPHSLKDVKFVDIPPHIPGETRIWELRAAHGLSNPGNFTRAGLVVELYSVDDYDTRLIHGGHMNTIEWDVDAKGEKGEKVVRIGLIGDFYFTFDLSDDDGLQNAYRWHIEATYDVLRYTNGNQPGDTICEACASSIKLRATAEHHASDLPDSHTRRARRILRVDFWEELERQLHNDARAFVTYH